MAPRATPRGRCQRLAKTQVVAGRGKLVLPTEEDIKRVFVEKQNRWLQATFDLLEYSQPSFWARKKAIAMHTKVPGFVLRVEKLTFLPAFFAAIVSEDSARVTAPRRVETGTGATASSKTKIRHEHGKKGYHVAMGILVWFGSSHVHPTSAESHTHQNDKQDDTKVRPEARPKNNDTSPG